jgi:hypothetical protein
MIWREFSPADHSIRPESALKEPVPTGAMLLDRTAQ